MAGDHHQCLNPTWHRLINVALRSPGRGGPGLLVLIFGQAAWGWGWESLSTWPNNFRRRESFPGAEPSSVLLSLLGRGWTR